MTKYGRFIYGDGTVYITSADFTPWDVEARSTYSATVGTVLRPTYGSHIRYGGTVKVPYKFDPASNFNTDF